MFDWLVDSKNIIDVLALIFSVISLWVSIWFVYVNRKNSRKAKIYAEDVYCSTVVVNSSKDREWRWVIDDDLLLKVYSQDQWITWVYQIIRLNKDTIIDKDREFVFGYETKLFDSTSLRVNAKEIKTFSTKYHAIEFALFSHKLSYKIKKTPFWNEYRFR